MRLPNPLLVLLFASLPWLPAKALAQNSALPATAGDDAPQALATQPGDLLDDPQININVPDIDFIRETLDNGLTVIYAPMENAPVVHVRVFYHVGSKDERPDRQGFAHMFEHMMFRGSEHVSSEEHMKLINSVGGNSNAFTSFDQTVYVNTVPANALEMALWLEADRMASFKVDDEKFVTERNVVNEEYLQRVVNPPYGRLFLDFFELAFDESHYQWTPIGDMEQLRQSTPAELQDFFDTYYAPNNAVLVIAGDFEVEQAKQWVQDYFAWIPGSGGGGVERRSPDEPPQQRAKRKVVYAPAAPLARVTMGYKTPGIGSEDAAALDVLGNILGQGRSSRLYQALVAGANGQPPIANVASAGNQSLEDAGIFFVSLGVLPEQDPDEAEARAAAVLQRFAKEGPTQAELEKAKTQLKLNLLRGRQTAEDIAGQLADAEALEDDANRVNTAAERLDAVTIEDVQRVAQKYFTDDNLTVLQYRPGEAPPEPATLPADGVPNQRAVPQQSADDLTTRPATRSAAQASPYVTEETVTIRRDRVVLHIQEQEENDTVNFPADYPTEPPVPEDVIAADFDMGESFQVGPLDVVVIRDDRLPLVGMTLIMPGGGDVIPDDKLGLASLTSDLISRGAGGLDATAFSEALERRGITLGAGDSGDFTQLSGGFPKGAMDEAAKLANLVLTQPQMDENEFRNLKFRALAGLRQALSNPSSVVGRETDTALFGDAPAGRSADLQSVANVILEDVVAWQQKAYEPTDATLILAGDVTQEEARTFAESLLQGWEAGESIGTADYDLEDYQRKILVIDNPAGGQSAVRLATRAFTNESEEKYAAAVATQILSGGIESRLNRSLRAEKGLTYGASGRFGPGRHAGDFAVGVATKPETTGEAVQAAFDVLERMATEPVTEAELAEAKRRVAGSLVLSTQTVGQHANLRGSIVMNDYPLDYFSNYADKIAEVTAEDVQNVIADYGDPQELSIVVVGPAEVVKPQLEPFGEVTVVPMPLQRGSD